MRYTKEQWAINAQKKEGLRPTSAPSADNKVTSRITQKEIPLNTLVEVRSGFHGVLTYESKKTGYKIIFENFGDTEYMELQELIAARNSSKKYFEKNWFLIDDKEILEFLNVDKYYKNAINVEDFDNIFNKSEKEIRNIINKMSKGQKEILINRAIRKIEDGTIDSRKIINALEEVLEVKLTDK